VWSEPELSAEEEAELAPVVKVRAQIHPLRPNAAAIYRSNAAAIYRSISTAGSCARARVCVCASALLVRLLAFCLVWVLTVGGVLLTLSVMAHAYHMIQVVGNTINDIIYGTVQTETRRRTAVFAAASFFTRTIAEFGHDTDLVCVCV